MRAVVLTHTGTTFSAGADLKCPAQPVHLRRPAAADRRPAQTGRRPGHRQGPGRAASACSAPATWRSRPATRTSPSPRYVSASPRPSSRCPCCRGWTRARPSPLLPDRGALRRGGGRPDRAAHARRRRCGRALWHRCSTGCARPPRRGSRVEEAGHGQGAGGIRPGRGGPGAALGVPVRVRRGPRGHDGLPGAAGSRMGAVATPSPQPKSPKQDRSRATRQRLLEAAVSCLAEHGWAGSTVSVVAERAGVSRGAAQHHFPTREDLFTAAVEYVAEERSTALRALPGRRTAPRSSRPSSTSTPARCSAPRCTCGSRRPTRSSCAPASPNWRPASAARPTASRSSSCASTNPAPAYAKRSRACSTWPAAWASPTSSPTTRPAAKRVVAQWAALLDEVLD